MEEGSTRQRTFRVIDSGDKVWGMVTGGEYNTVLWGL